MCIYKKADIIKHVNKKVGLTYIECIYKYIIIKMNCSYNREKFKCY